MNIVQNEEREQIRRIEKIFTKFLEQLGELGDRRHRIVDQIHRRMDAERIQELLKTLKH